MTIIVAISLIGFAILGGAFITGVFLENEDVKGVSGVLIGCWIILHAAFQAGAGWQRDDWKHLIEVQQVSKQ